MNIASNPFTFVKTIISLDTQHLICPVAWNSFEVLLICIGPFWQHVVFTITYIPYITCHQCCEHQCPILFVHFIFFPVLIGIIHNTSSASNVQFLMRSFFRSAVIPSNHLSLDLPLFHSLLVCPIIHLIFLHMRVIFHVHLNLTDFISQTTFYKFVFYKLCRAYGWNEHHWPFHINPPKSSSESVFQT